MWLICLVCWLWWIVVILVLMLDVVWNRWLENWLCWFWFSWLLVCLVVWSVCLCFILWRCVSVIRCLVLFLFWLLVMLLYFFWLIRLVYYCVWLGFVFFCVNCLGVLVFDGFFVRFCLWFCVFSWFRCWFWYLGIDVKDIVYIFLCFVVGVVVVFVWWCWCVMCLLLYKWVVCWCLFFFVWWWVWFWLCWFGNCFWWGLWFGFLVFLVFIWLVEKWGLLVVGRCGLEDCWDVVVVCIYLDRWVWYKECWRYCLAGGRLGWNWVACVLLLGRCCNFFLVCWGCVVLVLALLLFLDSVCDSLRLMGLCSVGLGWLWCECVVVWRVLCRLCWFWFWFCLCRLWFVGNVVNIVCLF